MTIDKNKIVDRSEDEQKKSIEMFESFRDELNKRELSNTENYDKSILTLSSAGLAISMSFVKGVVPLDSAQYLFLLQGSWLLFLLTIVLSLVAYIISNKAIKKQLFLADEYYVQKKAYALNYRNRLSEINSMINAAVGFLFAVAIALLVFFVICNVDIREKGSNMTDKNRDQSNKVSVLRESSTVPSMAKVPTDGIMCTDSAEIPTMHAAPSSGSSITQPKPQPQETQGDSSKK